MSTAAKTVMEEKESLKLGSIIMERIFVMFGINYRNERVRDLQYKLKLIDLAILILAWSGGLLALISCENNMTFEFIPSDSQKLYNLKVVSSTDPELRRVVTVSRSLNSFFTLLVLVLLYFHYKMLLKLEKMKMNIKPEMEIISSGYYKWLLLEIFLNIWHMPPLQEEYSVLIPQRNDNLPAQSIFFDNILTITLIFFRSYHIIKYLSFHSQFNKYQCEKICLECNTPLDFLFLIKAEFKTRPFFLVSVIMIVSIFVFGYSVRSIEMFFMYGGDPNKVQDWRYYWNGMWCVIITMSTVGFGDFYPISILGRAIIVIACFWGTFLISLMVAALTVAVEFNPQEAVSYDTIKAAHSEMEYGKLGTIIIQTSLRYYLHMKQIRTDPSLMQDKNFRYKKSLLFNKLKDNIEAFRNLKKNKSEKIESWYIEYSINKIDENLTVEMDKIRHRIGLVENIRDLLETYEKNQNLIKMRTIELYKEIEEINIFREKYLKH